MFKFFILLSLTAAVLADSDVVELREDDIGEVSIVQADDKEESQSESLSPEENEALTRAVYEALMKQYESSGAQSAVRPAIRPVAIIAPGDKAAYPMPYYKSPYAGASSFYMGQRPYYAAPSFGASPYPKYSPFYASAANALPYQAYHQAQPAQMDAYYSAPSYPFAYRAPAINSPQFYAAQPYPMHAAYYKPSAFASFPSAYGAGQSSQYAAYQPYYYHPSPVRSQQMYGEYFPSANRRPFYDSIAASYYPGVQK